MRKHYCRPCCFWVLFVLQVLDKGRNTLELRPTTKKRLKKRVRGKLKLNKCNQSYEETILLYALYLFAHIVTCFYVWFNISEFFHTACSLRCNIRNPDVKSFQNHPQVIKIGAFVIFWDFFLFSDKTDHKNITISREPKVLVVIFCFPWTYTFDI